jgi:hypothetical protein
MGGGRGPFLLIPSYASFEAPILLEFSLALSAYLEALYLLFFPSTQFSSVIFILHRVFCRIWIKSRVEIFEAKSIFLHQIQHDTCLFIVFPIVFRLRRHQTQLLWTSTCRSVVCMCRQVNLTR